MEMTVVTYGGGEVLKNIFDAIAMLMNRQSGDLFRPMLIITASIGGLLAISKAMLSGAAEGLVGKYFIPLIAVMGLLCVPTSTVHIEDVLRGKAHTVSHVPLFLAKFTEMVSSIGYRLTAGMESLTRRAVLLR